MIRNVCIHIANEQPLLADMYSLPSAADAGLLCTNVRGLDGKRPVFIDHTSSTFFFPYHVVRFLEIPSAAVKASGVRPGRQAAPAEVSTDATAAPDDDPERRLAVAVGGPDDGEADEDAELDIEIDEGFLQRIRDI